MVWQVEGAAAKPELSSSLRTLMVEGRRYCKVVSDLHMHTVTCLTPLPINNLKMF